MRKACAGARFELEASCKAARSQTVTTASVQHKLAVLRCQHVVHFNIEIVKALDTRSGRKAEGVDINTMM